MKTSSTFLAAAAAVLGAAVIAAGCGGASASSGSTTGSSSGSAGNTSAGGYGNSYGTSKPAKATSGAAAVAVRSTSLGTILVDGRGMTLYLFEKDTGPTSMCSGQCATFWPPLTTKGAPKAGSGVTAAMLGTSKRSDGTTQVTYSGHPLYGYTGDQNPGDTTGQGVNAFGALWYVLSPAGQAIK